MPNVDKADRYRLISRKLYAEVILFTGNNKAELKTLRDQHRKSQRMTGGSDSFYVYDTLNKKVVP